jgi:hypothetical protein
VEERLAPDAGGQLVRDRDGGVDGAAGQRRPHVAELHRHGDHAHAGRLAHQRAQQGRQQPGLGGVGEAEAEGAVAALRRELRWGQGRLDQRAQVGLGPGPQALAPAGQRQPPAPPREEWSPHRGGQPAQGRAHRRLGQVQTAGRPGHAAALCHHREDAQQVEVQISSIIFVHVFHIAYSLG